MKAILMKENGECVGVVVEDPSGACPKGQQVATMVGGMARISGFYYLKTMLPLWPIAATFSFLPKTALMVL